MQAHVEYETEKRHYAHVDCPGHADYVKVGSRVCSCGLDLEVPAASDLLSFARFW